MDLIRILRREVLFKVAEGEEACEESVCGSAVRNFEVHPKLGSLSFFHVGSVDELGLPQLERVAMAVTVGQQKLDDVAYCFVEEEFLAHLGVEVDNDGKGITKFADVDANHVSVRKVTLKRLSGLTVECARQVGCRPATVVSRGRVAYEVDCAVGKGELKEEDFDPKFLRALTESRRTNPYKLAVRKAAAVANMAND
jgi:hypothetical protein